MLIRTLREKCMPLDRRTRDAGIDGVDILDEQGAVRIAHAARRGITFEGKMSLTGIAWIELRYPF